MSYNIKFWNQLCRAFLFIILEKNLNNYIGLSSGYGDIWLKLKLNFWKLILIIIAISFTK
jgi:hypothetical protein